MARIDVSSKGLRKLAQSWPCSFVLRELWQNAIDTDAKVIEVSVSREGPMRVVLTVEDDDPQGFKTFSHAWTMYAESEKVTDPTKAGRFNIGEKYVIALATTALIETTTGR